MKQSKRMLVLLMAASLAAALSGCAPNAGEAEKTVVTLVYDASLANFEALVEEKLPDVDLQCEHEAANPLSSTIRRRLQAGRGPDLVISTQPADAESISYLLPLDGYAFSAQYESAVLKNLFIQERLYHLPLPGQYNGYVVNKTLLDRAGLDLPGSNRELIRVLTTLRDAGVGMTDTGHVFGLREISYPAVGTFVVGCMVPDFLGTTWGVQWLADFEGGQAGMSGVWEAGFALLEELVEKDLINVMPFSRQGNAINNAAYMGRGRLVAAFGSSAFLTECEQINSEAVANGEAEPCEYAFLPFFGTGDTANWTLALPADYIGINARLREKGNEKKLDACLRILEVLSTQEGQAAIMEDLRLDNSDLKGFSRDARVVPAGLEAVVADGYVYYARLPGKVVEYLGMQAAQFLGGKKDVAQCLAAVDEYYLNGAEEAEADLSVVGSVAEDLVYQIYNTRRMETALGNLVADSIALFADAPIAVANGGGIRASLYAGEVLGEDLKAVCPYDNQIIVVRMSGTVLLEMLENGLSALTADAFVPGGRFLQVSGIAYTFDSSQPAGSRLVEARLADGAPVDPEAVYTVAVTNYMAGSNGYLEGNGDGYVMLNLYSAGDEPAREVELVAENLGTFRDALRCYFAQNQDAPVTARVEGRIVNVAAQ